jgi:hypothetical protein
MSQQDNFSGGFILGAVLGGIAGGILGAILTNRAMETEAEESDRLSPKPSKPSVKRSLRVAPTESFEVTAESARRSLEDKIAQLNDALDDVRDQLKRVDHGPERSGLEASDDKLS